MAYQDTVYYRLKEAVKARIVSLHESDPSGLDIGTRVFSDIVPDEIQATYPCVFLTVAEEQEEDWGGSTETVWTWLPIRVFLADRQGLKRDIEREGRYLTWREHIANGFHQLKEPRTVPEVAWCDIRRSKIFDQKLPFYQYIVTGFTLRFFIQEPRITSNL